MTRKSCDHKYFAHRYYFAAEIRYTVPAMSSDTNNDPSVVTATPTGRPYTSLFVGSDTNPVKNGAGSPLGFPSLKGTNTTWYPARGERFHEPCSATNAPAR